MMSSMSLAQWFLSHEERANPHTRIDAVRGDDQAWSTGNSVRPIVHGATYFADLADRISQMGEGDRVYFVDWRGDPDEHLNDDGLTLVEVLTAALDRGVDVRGLLWRSHWRKLGFHSERSFELGKTIEKHGGQCLRDMRVRTGGAHHQKFVVLRHPGRPELDVAFLGGIDVAHSRRDDADHHGDPQHMPFATWYGGEAAWHDVQIAVRGPAVRDVEEVFRERWADPASLTRGPWRLIQHRLDGPERGADPLPDPLPDPAATGTCAVQLLRTYPNRRPGYPFAPFGERSIARGYAKALGRAQRLVYLEDQYLWSTSIARVFAQALRRSPGLHLVVVVPRFPDQAAEQTFPVALHGHTQALDIVREAGGDRVLICDLESPAGLPVYVHSKVCVVDDVWATVGSDNFNRRSWTHDSELTAAVVDSRRDPREPRDPAGLGDGARTFARDLRLELWREHLELPDDDALLDVDTAVATLRGSVAELDAWYAGGCGGPRPAGRLRTHVMAVPTPWQRRLAAPAYRTMVDPDGRPPRMKVRGHH